jgi:hypothetical protein
MNALFIVDWFETHVIYVLSSCTTAVSAISWWIAGPLSYVLPLDSSVSAVRLVPVLFCRGGWCAQHVLGTEAAIVRQVAK